MNGARIVVCVLVSLFAASSLTGLGDMHADRQAVPLPQNIVADAALTEILTMMLAVSPSFCAQCRRISSVGQLRVRLERADDVRDRVGRAECRMSRYRYGALEARVNLWSLADAPELIGHELEHVIEFSEGLNYPALAIVSPGVVWKAGVNHFETRRAIDAGERVAREVADASRRAARSLLR